MRVGVLARADDRGLGRQAYEMWRHVPDARALVVLNPTSEAQGFPQRPERYGEGATTVTVDTRRWILPERECREWLRMVDVVYAPETLYDWRLADWARELGVRTVVHVNPEFWRPRDPMPDVLWAPTSWRLEHLPAGTRVVPVPVATEDFTPATLNVNHRLRLLHVAGHVAAGDRAGTNIVGETTRHLPDVEWTVRTQDRSIPGITRRQRWTVELGGRADHRTLYEGADVLVHPRRYGGLSLVTNEAMAAGLAVIMPDVSPNREWPIVPVRARGTGQIFTATGRLPTAVVAPADLALAVRALMVDRDLLGHHQAESRAWAEAHSWDALLPVVLHELAT